MDSPFAKFQKKKFAPKSSSKKRSPKFKEEKPFVKRTTDTESKERESKEGMRLNKFLAHAGIASRRKADELIGNGLVKVNGKVVKEMGFKVSDNDRVQFKGEVLTRDRKVYILLNKPKDFITTTQDEKGRKTVMHLIRNATDERVYPVGRLDRNTTGLLLLTNDGDLAQRMTHPSHSVKKIYLVVLDKPLSDKDMEKIAGGVLLEDGMALIDSIEFPDGNDKTKVGIELHIGKNRIVRRIFESFGYEVVRLDRVSFGGLTKKDLPRGKWRLLSQKEIGMLKFFTGKVPKKDQALLQDYSDSE